MQSTESASRFDIFLLLFFKKILSVLTKASKGRSRSPIDKPSGLLHRRAAPVDLNANVGKAIVSTHSLPCFSIRINLFTVYLVCQCNIRKEG